MFFQKLKHLSNWKNFLTTTLGSKEHRLVISRTNMCENKRLPFAEHMHTNDNIYKLNMSMCVILFTE